jgi:pimeloyl-ACP methyl ester carboxylesterase
VREGALRGSALRRPLRLEELDHGHVESPSKAQIDDAGGVVWGAADPTFAEADARAMTSQFPNIALFRSIPHAKLFLQEEQPDAPAAATLECLTGAAA